MSRDKTRQATVYFKKAAPENVDFLFKILVSICLWSFTLDLHEMGKKIFTSLPIIFIFLYH